LNESEEVLDAILPSRDQSAVALHPGEEALYLPAAAIATQWASILRLLLAIGPVGRDHLDAVFLHLLIQRIRVVGLVTNQSFWQLVEEASGQNSFHKPALGRRSALDRYGERKTVTRGDSDDLGTFAALGWADGKAPFLALAKAASTNASSRWSLPHSCRCLANRRSASTNLPSPTHCWKRRWQVWYGGYFAGISAH